MALCTALAGAAEPATGRGRQGDAPHPYQWRLDPERGGRGELVAVAQSPDGALASGGTRGVELTRVGETRRIALRAPVTDLVFDAGARLYAATTAGLFQIGPNAVGSRDISPGRGDRVRDIARVVAAGPELAVATAAGVFWRRGASPWRRIDTPGSGERGVTALAIVLRGPAPSHLWIGGPRGLFVAEPAGGHAARAVPLPDAAGGIVDLLVDATSLYVLTEGSLVRIELDTRGRAEPSDLAGVPDAEVFPLRAAPGAAHIRLARGADGFFLATERGLWRARAARGPWQRAADPAGRAAWLGLAASSRASGVALAGPRGLLIGDPVGPALAVSDSARHRDALPPSRPPRAEACAGPAVVEVHRHVLRTLRLEGDPAAAMRRGVRRRGWLPIFRLEGAYRVEEEHGSDFDQSYVAGGLRELSDWDRDRGRGHEIGAALSWDFGDVFYHPEEIDVSTEARRLVELRDDILDEVNQLYFDRARALEERSDPLRVAHLGAGLDAWTGGWWSRALAARCGGAEGSAPP